MTLNTAERRRWFADPQAARELVAQIPTFFESRHFAVVAYCLMPDHLHLVLEGTSEGADLREVMRIWKQVTSHAWKNRGRGRLWQPGFHDRVLRECDDARGVVGYVVNNPVRAGLVTRMADYPWTGSSRYTLEALAEHVGEWAPSWK